jgi:subtilisin family serine protease
MPLITSAGAIVEPTTVSGLYEVQGPPSSMGTLAQSLSASPTVQYAVPVETIQDAMVPNDPYFDYGLQWALNGTWGINAPTAWNTTTGSTGVIVADVDTGINYNHPDLADNVWLNQAEIPAGVRSQLTD